MDLQMIKKSGESFNLEQYDIVVKDFNVSSIPLNSIYQKSEGSDRYIDYGSNFDKRVINVLLEIRAKDLMDYPLLRDKLFELVLNKESFYIREMRRSNKLSYAFVDTNEPPRYKEGTENKFVNGKRYLVKLRNFFVLDQMGLDGEAELVFETTELPFAESIGTTQDIQQNGGITYDSELWSYGMGLLHDDESHIYTHNALEFSIYNAGNVAIHPFEQELEIIISNAAENYELKNLTTGDTFKYTGDTQGTLKLDGPNITLNSLQAFRDTNKKYITLAPGWNHFKQNQNREVSFDFRYYYL